MFEIICSMGGLLCVGACMCVCVCECCWNLIFLILLGLPDVSCCPPACGGPFGACCCCCCAIKLYVKASEAAKLKMIFVLFLHQQYESFSNAKECVFLCVREKEREREKCKEKLELPLI